MASIPISIMISTMTPILISIPGWGFAGIITNLSILKKPHRFGGKDGHRNMREIRLIIFWKS